MAYTHRWLNRTRIQVNRLEDRLQPGSLLLGGLDLAAVENVLPRPEQDSSDHEIRKVTHQTNEDTAVVASAETSEIVFSRATVTASQPMQPGSPIDPDPITPSNAAPARPARTVVNPAFRAPEASADVATSRPITAQQNGFPQSGANFKAPTPIALALPQSAAEPAHGEKADATGLKPLTGLTFTPMTCEGAATKAFIFNTYQGGFTGAGGTVDGSLAVSGGKVAGLGLGDTYSIGYNGLDAMITRYSSAGACIATLIVSSGVGLAVRGTDVWVNQDAVYAVGTLAGNTGGFVAALDFGLTTIVGFNGKTAPAGGEIAYEGVSTRCRGGPRNVFVTGMLRDPALGTVQRMMDFQYNPLIAGAAVYEVSWGFTSAGLPVDAYGLEVDVESLGDHYIAGKLDNTAGVPRPSTMRVSGVPAIVWAFSLTAGSPAADVDNGMHGVKVLDGTSTASHVYSSGVVRDTVVNPGFDLMLVVKWTKATGTPLLYAFVYQIPGADIGSYQSAADRSGNQYLAGYLNSPGLAYDGHISKLAVGGGSITNQRLVGDLGGPARDVGTGVDLVLPSTSSDVLSGGETSSAAMSPGPLGCDTTLDGVQDGYVIKDAQPLGT